MARPATTIDVAVPRPDGVSVLLCEEVPLRACRLKHVRATQAVLSVRHRFQVRRVDAGSVAAQMIKRETRRHRGEEQLIGQAVREPGTAAVADVPVTTRDERSCPLPAALRREDSLAPHGVVDIVMPLQLLGRLSFRHGFIVARRTDISVRDPIYGQEMLSDLDLSILQLEQRHYRRAGAKEQAIHDELGLTSTQYTRRLNRLIDDPDAVLVAPQLVNRLRRVRERRIRQRVPRAS